MHWFSSRVLILIAAAAIVLSPASVSRLSARNKNADHIEPYVKNPRYWQYDGKPVMLLGGNKWDAPFFVQDQKSVYDDLRAAGGNYLRYILKQRLDDGGRMTRLVRIFPFRKLRSGKYDLNQWSDDYRNRFSSGLQMCYDRRIVVQITLWGRFDFYAKNDIKAMRAFTDVVVPWETSPRQDLLTDRADDEAYLRAKTGEIYGLYFVDTGSVGLKLHGVSGTFRLCWIDIAAGGYTGAEQTLTAGSTVIITTPGSTAGGWAAVIARTAGPSVSAPLDK